MNIYDIIPDFSKMSEEQILERIREVRRSRTTRKEVSLKARPAKEAEKASTKVGKAVASLSPAEVALLKKLLS